MLVLTLLAAIANPDPHPVALAMATLRQSKTPRTPAVCAPLETAVAQSLAQAQLTAERLYPCMIEIKPGATGKTPSIPEKLANAGVRMLFDVAYLLEHPYSAATFDRLDRIVRVPESYVIAPHEDDPVLRHELVHVAIWAAAQKDTRTQLAYLSGTAYQPHPLELDEMRAYADDLFFVAQQLKKQCKKANTEAWANIRAQRLAGQPAADNLQGCDALFDKAVSKTIFGQNHTDPVLPALDALKFVALTLDVEGDNPEIILRGTAKLHNNEDTLFDLHLVTLAQRRSRDTKPDVEALLKQTKAHQALWKNAQELVEKLAKAKPKELSGLLDTLAKRTKPPMTTPGL